MQRLSRHWPGTWMPRRSAHRKISVVWWRSGASVSELLHAQTNGAASQLSFVDDLQSHPIDIWHLAVLDHVRPCH
ncbi:hypothetical protein K461DRAFT_279292 [Myriangium duriaei CBS 260.36]|uniref:Uncharacterized protein n=1 Tax=Myriangium duriaei CBS 260.36 TaxID=1168546 RepID=A0A9P4MJ69_9PEZI|nr:hypothetical protein K461DRAFT_279292 [Myriangium duriaei CBS 260.36]